MKKLTLLSVLLSYGLSFSQPANPANGGNMQRITNYGQQAFIDFGNKSLRQKGNSNRIIQGSQYFNENFKEANLKYFGNDIKEGGYMRYNGFSDEIEMSSTPGNWESDVILIKSKDVVPVIEGEKFIYLPYRLDDGRAVLGYLIEIFSGEKLNLYLKKKKTFMEAVEARTSLENSFPARYVESTDIYVSVDGDTPIPLKRTKKSIISFFDSNSSEVKAFIKSNRLKVNDIKSLIKIFEFAEKL